MKHPLRSSVCTDGRRMAGARALWVANGMKREQFGKPIIAIVNSFTQFVPGHTHLHEAGQIVKAEIEKLGCYAAEFNTIAIDDGIAMGHDGMLYSLPSRDIIADSVEYMCNAHKADFHAADFPDEPWLKDRFAVFGDVAGDIGEVRLLCQLEKVVCTIVEFMVAGDGDVVADGVHDVDNAFTSGEQADGLTLDSVAVVHKKKVVIVGELLLHGVEANIPPAPVDSAVNVTGVEDQQVFFFRPVGV